MVRKPGPPGPDLPGPSQRILRIIRIRRSFRSMMSGPIVVTQETRRSQVALSANAPRGVTSARPRSEVRIGFILLLPLQSCAKKVCWEGSCRACPSFTALSVPSSNFRIVRYRSHCLFVLLAESFSVMFRFIVCFSSTLYEFIFRAAAPRRATAPPTLSGLDQRVGVRMTYYWDRNGPIRIFPNVSQEVSKSATV